MSSRSAREENLFQNFKKEAKLVTLKSENSSKKCIKWNGQIFMTGSFVQVFKKVKNR